MLIQFDQFPLLKPLLVKPKSGILGLEILTFIVKHVFEFIRRIQTGSICLPNNVKHYKYRKKTMDDLAMNLSITVFGITYR